jgi:hypothetical protein
MKVKENRKAFKKRQRIYMRQGAHLMRKNLRGRHRGCRMTDPIPTLKVKARKRVCRVRNKNPRCEAIGAPCGRKRCGCNSYP